MDYKAVNQRSELLITIEALPRLQIGINFQLALRVSIQSVVRSAGGGATVDDTMHADYYLKAYARALR